MRALALIFCLALAACCSLKPAPERPAPVGDLVAAVDSLQQLAREL